MKKKLKKVLDRFICICYNMGISREINDEAYALVDSSNKYNARYEGRKKMEKMPGYKYHKQMLGRAGCCMDVTIGDFTTYGLLIQSWGVPFRFWEVLIEDPDSFDCAVHAFSTFGEAKRFFRTAKCNGWYATIFVYQKID